MLPRINHMFRLTKDVTCNYTNSGVAIAELSLVSSKKYGEKEYKVFLPGKAFKKTAELLASVTKGQRIYVSGELQTETWDKDGKTQYKTVLYINEFQYVEKKQDGQQSAGPQNYQGGFQNPQGTRNQSGGFNQNHQPDQHGQFQGPPDDSEIPF